MTNPTTNTLDPTGPQKAAPKEKVMTRQQRRFQERISEEAKAMHEKLAENFLLFFSQHEDPEGQAVQDKIKQISAQWRLYCSRRQLNAKAFLAMDEFMNGILQQYQYAKNEPNTDNI